MYATYGAAPAMSAWLISLIVWSASVWISCGFFTAYVASKKYKSAELWFFLGLLFGFIALIAIVGVPDEHVRASTNVKAGGGVLDRWLNEGNANSSGDDRFPPR